MTTIITASRVDVTDDDINLDATKNDPCNPFDCTCQGCIWDG